MTPVANPENFLVKADRWLARRVLRRPLRLSANSPVVSFTFDDAPASACLAGRYLLEEHGARGTWYVAGGLTGKTEQGLPQHSADQLRQLAENGHDIGCHTFSHRPCQNFLRSELQDEFSRNAEFLLRITGKRPAHFAYPLGVYGTQAKLMASQHFASSRLTRPGIHFGSADLNGLLAHRLYSAEMTPKRLACLIRSTAQGQGWLIFYTHDVATHPSPWGCTPNLLATAIQLAQTHHCKVLSVEEATRHLGMRDSIDAT